MNRTRIGIVAVLVALPALGACDDVFTLDVESPGRVADDDLNTADAIDGIVVGMSFNLSDAIDVTLQDVAMAGGNLWHGGSYDFGSLPRGDLSDARDWDAEFGDMQQARWVAEDGLRRIRRVLGETAFESNPQVARAYLLGGFANRLLGEYQCSSTVDGGPEVPNSEHFRRADSLFARAVETGTVAGADAIVTAAHGGRASVLAWLGDWDQAAAEARQVPRDFTYVATFDQALNNDLVFETTSRREFTVFTTEWQAVPDDPRVPWVGPLLDASGDTVVGQDGSTPFFQQRKYEDLEADVPLTKGTEMLVLRAEARLRAGDLDGMTALLNEARAFYAMEPLAVPSDAAAAWRTLRFERNATLWLEGRRIWDLRRWEEDGGIVADPFAAGRQLCFPIGDEERRANPNLGP